MKSGFINENNMVLVTDHYQLTMAAAYFTNGLQDKQATFDLFVRKLPKNRNYLIAAGLEQCLHYLENVHFEEEHVEWLRRRPEFERVDQDFFDYYLPRFRFTGDVKAIPEGTPIFPNEPILEVTAPIIEAQIAETYLISATAGQTLVASKASRVVNSAKGKPVTDFGLRRAHCPQAGVYASRACYIGGCVATSNDFAGYLWDIPATGTMAHSYVQSYENELEAFKDYSTTYPSSTIALIDTYNTVKGAKLASRLGKALKGVRIDSGNLLKESIKVRKVLNDNNCEHAKIVVSSDLNEYKIDNLERGIAKIDCYGVGTEMVVSKDAPAISLVYKLVQVDDAPKIKLSKDKVTYPGKKMVFRHNSFDVLGLEGELSRGKYLLKQVMNNGRSITTRLSLKQVREYSLEQVASLPEILLSLEQARPYEVRISPGLESLTEDLKTKYGGGI